LAAETLLARLWGSIRLSYLQPSKERKKGEGDGFLPLEGEREKRRPRKVFGSRSSDGKEAPWLLPGKRKKKSSEGREESPGWRGRAKGRAAREGIGNLLQYLSVSKNSCREKRKGSALLFKGKSVDRVRGKTGGG